MILFYLYVTGDDDPFKKFDLSMLKNWMLSYRYLPLPRFRIVVLAPQLAGPAQRDQKSRKWPSALTWRSSSIYFSPFVR